MSVSSSLYVLSFALLLQAAIGINPIKHYCSSLIFLHDSQFESNVNQIMNLLQHHTPPSGYSQNTVGNILNRVYGLAMCRGDVKDKDCRACVSEATSEIKNLCPNARMAVIWSDNCMLKYSYLDFFGTVDYLHFSFNYNPYNKIKYEPNFIVARNNFLNQMVMQAHRSPRLFAIGQSKLGNSSLYGYAQCTRDLSKSDCQQCLSTAVNRFRKSDSNKSTGWFGFGSCNIRYETYPFVKY